MCCLQSGCRIRFLVEVGEAVVVQVITSEYLVAFPRRLRSFQLFRNLVQAQVVWIDLFGKCLRRCRSIVLRRF